MACWVGKYKADVSRHVDREDRDPSCKCRADSAGMMSAVQRWNSNLSVVFMRLENCCFIAFVRVINRDAPTYRPLKAIFPAIDSLKNVR